MKTKSFQDPLLPRAVLGRKRVRFRHVTGVPYKEAVEYRIMQLKKELGKTEVKSVKYQLMFLGDWKDVSFEDYQECLKLNMKVRMI